MESFANGHFWVIGIGVVAAISLLLLLLACGALLWLMGKVRSQAREKTTLLEKLQLNMRNETDVLRREIQGSAMENRKETAVLQGYHSKQLTDFLRHSAETSKGQLDSFARQLSELTTLNQTKFDNIKLSLEQSLTSMRQNNDNKLDEMRKIVDEKLQATLEQRLAASFKQVSERLEQVFKGLGEMQALAGNVGDLKRLLSNVKTRGTWGEIRLGHILEQILTKDQYATNVCVKPNSAERVEFVICLPGNAEDNGKPVYLPIDSKFPQEDYLLLQQAQQRADAEAVAAATRALRATILNEAKNISGKYIVPPNTTDFAIMFLPTESLYAEILNIPGVCEDLQNKYRIVVAGPTTMAALLNSLQMGFRTLSIQKRSSEVWQVLAGVKAEFLKFYGILEKVEKNLAAASKTVELARKKTGTINIKLRKVEEVPMAGLFDEALPLEEALDDDSPDDDEI